MSGLEDEQQACRALLEVLLLVQRGACIVLLMVKQYSIFDGGE
jgi:hypothetical protein